MLIASSRHSSVDLETWAMHERTDAVNAESTRLDQKVVEAARAIRYFVDAGGPAYCGVSWGKDSVVVAHLVTAVVRVSLPLVWVRVRGKENPDCPAVRDAFLSSHGAMYEEIEVDAPGRGLTSSIGFAEARLRHGVRHVSGVRAQESRERMLRSRRHGTSTEATCAPLTWWTSDDVFAYLYREALPVHPAYACSQGGLWERGRIRVGALGGERGRGHGRHEWEQRYYGT